MKPSDIKLVIDQLNSNRTATSFDKVAIESAVNALETLGNQVVQQAEEIRLLKQAVQHEADCVDAGDEKIAKQAAVIESLMHTLNSVRFCVEAIDGTSVANEHIHDNFMEALAIPTDSKQILTEWLDEVLGEPQFYMSLNGFGNKTKYEGYPIPLFKKPEIK